MLTELFPCLKTTSDQVKNTWGGVYNQSKLYNALMNQKYRGFTIRCKPLVTLGLSQKMSLTCTSKIRKVWRRRKREKQHDLNNIGASVANDTRGRMNCIVCRAILSAYIQKNAAELIGQYHRVVRVYNEIHPKISIYQTKQLFMSVLFKINYYYTI